MSTQPIPRRRLASVRRRRPELVAFLMLAALALVVFAIAFAVGRLTSHAQTTGELPANGQTSLTTTIPAQLGSVPSIEVGVPVAAGNTVSEPHTKPSAERSPRHSSSGSSGTSAAPTVEQTGPVTVAPTAPSAPVSKAPASTGSGSAGPGSAGSTGSTGSSGSSTGGSTAGPGTSFESSD